MECVVCDRVVRSITRSLSTSSKYFPSKKINSAGSLRREGERDERHYSQVVVDKFKRISERAHGARTARRIIHRWWWQQ